MRKVLFILGELHEADLHWLSRAGRTVTVADGDALITEGDALDRLFIVTDGVFAVSIRGIGEVARLGVGEVVGDMSMLDRRPANATVAAVGPAQAYAIPHAELLPELQRNPGFGSRFYRAISIFLANRLNRAMTMAGRDGVPRLEDNDPDEIGGELLDTVSLAGARFRSFLSQIQHR